MLEPDQELVLYDTQQGRWLAPGQDFEVAPGGSRPSPRNAAAMVQLRPKRGGGGQGVPGQGGQGAEFLLFGGWRAFVESYASTHVLRVEVGASA